MPIKSLKKIGVLISGGGSNFQALIDQIHLQHGEIRMVISSNPDAFGLERATTAGIASAVVGTAPEEADKKIVGMFKEQGIELVVLAGYMKIVTPAFVDAFPNAIINIHPALIPAFCGKGFYGMHVHRAVMNYGVKVTGATVHFVNEVADGGPIIAQETVEIMADDTPESIQKKVLQIEHKLLPDAVKAFCLDQLKVEGRIVRRIV